MRGSWNQNNADEGFSDILSVIDMAAEKLCDINPDWERSSRIKRGVRAMLFPYYEIPQERRKIKTFDVTFFLDVF